MNGTFTIGMKENNWYDKANIIASDIDELLFPKALSGQFPLTITQNNYVTIMFLSAYMFPIKMNILP